MFGTSGYYVSVEQQRRLYYWCICGFDATSTSPRVAAASIWALPNPMHMFVPLKTLISDGNTGECNGQATIGRHTCSAKVSSGYVMRSAAVVRLVLRCSARTAAVSALLGFPAPGRPSYVHRRAGASCAAAAPTSPSPPSDAIAALSAATRLPRISSTARATRSAASMEGAAGAPKSEIGG